MIEIRKENCKICRKCTSVCPCGLIEMKEGQVHIKDKATRLCMNCGHCQAVCRFEAILLEGEPSRAIPKEAEVSFESVKALIESNRSIRRFKDEMVPKAHIEEIIRTLDCTASAKNKQAIHYIVISSKEKVQEISNISVDFIKEAGIAPEVIRSIEILRNPITVDAPHILLAYAKNDSILPEVDSVIKVASAALMMHSEGIGSCYLGYLQGFVNNSEALRSHLGLNSDENVYCAIAFGYNDNEVYTEIPYRKPSNIRFIE